MWRKFKTLVYSYMIFISNLQCTMVGALKSPCFFLASLVAVTKATNRATLGIARSFHDVNLMCETPREEAAF